MSMRIFSEYNYRGFSPQHELGAIDQGQALESVCLAKRMDNLFTEASMRRQYYNLVSMHISEISFIFGQINHADNAKQFALRVLDMFAIYHNDACRQDRKNHAAVNVALRICETVDNLTWQPAPAHKMIGVVQD